MEVQQLRMDVDRLEKALAKAKQEAVEAVEAVAKAEQEKVEAVAKAEQEKVEAVAKAEQETRNAQMTVRVLRDELAGAAEGPDAASLYRASGVRESHHEGEPETYESAMGPSSW
ncbi:hypothetical protein FOA52_006525 [Chlamydomonas sp. UWO 241]|nr:hypothetical protein FOA52_006525 [Chlamydomonas sp. UWO 241]